MRKSIRELIEQSDFISIDTSALMEVDSLQKFVSKYEFVFMKYGRIIFVYKEVIRELKTHMAGKDAAKRYLAGKAMDIMIEHPKLFRFQICVEDVVDRKTNSFIADQKFLSVVALYKTAHTQLFISNDKDLLDGILSIDRIEAVHGKPVYAAKLTPAGVLESYELQISEQLPVSGEEDNIKVIEDIEDDEMDFADGGDDGLVTVIGSILGAAVIGGIAYFLKNRKGA